MRIIAGTLKGKKLFSPKNQLTRPTSDYNREALFNILCHNLLVDELSHMTVLDLFAGSGALGLEALSRGALKATFVENNHHALACIKKNIELCQLQSKTEIINNSAITFTNFKQQAYSLVFIDPPYNKSLLTPALNNLIKQNLLAPKALIAVETAKDEERFLPSNYQKITQKIYGSTKITFCSYE